MIHRQNIRDTFEQTDDFGFSALATEIYAPTALQHIRKKLRFFKIEVLQTSGSIIHVMKVADIKC